MAGYNNHAYDPMTSVAKGAGDAGSTVASGSAAGTIAVLALTLFDTGLDATQQAAVVGIASTVVASLTQGWRRWRRNRRKHRPDAVLPEEYGG